MLAESGAADEAIEVFERAYDRAIVVDDLWLAAWSLYHEALTLRLRGRLQPSLEKLNRLFDLLEASSEPITDVYAPALEEAGIVSSMLGDFAQGNSYLRRALEQYDAADSTYDRAKIHDALGSNLLLSGNLMGAQIQFERAQALWESLASSGIG